MEHVPGHHACGIAGSRTAGFGLFDTLVALLLLAIALLGSGAALRYAMRATHASMLQSRAIDLVADLAETLHAAGPDADTPTLIALWRERVPDILPAAGADAVSVVARSREPDPGHPPLRWLDVRLRWHGLAGTGDDSVLLPVPDLGAAQ